jgi:acyl-homoserine lactone acylase PvdQ
VPFEQMPQSVDPDVGYVANWNNKPATGWIDEFLEPASSRSAARQPDPGDPRAAREAAAADAGGAAGHGVPPGQPRPAGPGVQGLLTAVSARTPTQTAALDLLRAWDGTTYGPRAGTSEGAYTDGTVTDGPAKTLWMRYMDELRDEVLASLPREVVVQSDFVASHVYDASPADNLVLRVLNPRASSLTPSRDYLAGRTPGAAMLAALDRSIAALTAQYGADPASWRMPHERRPIRSLTGVIGPSLTMPYMDRGSWVHTVAFTKPAASRPTRPAPSARPTDAALPATGPSALRPRWRSRCSARRC